jgi:hypothetical protein
MSGDRAAIALAVFIAIFWTSRIIIDFTYFNHDDWPKGSQFIVGHFFLIALFAALAGTYWTVRAWPSNAKTGSTSMKLEALPDVRVVTFVVTLGQNDSIHFTSPCAREVGG